MINLVIFQFDAALVVILKNVITIRKERRAQKTKDNHKKKAKEKVIEI